MAGSYNHAVNHEGDGQLLCNEQFAGMIENIGDAYEMAEEMYGMIHFLAEQIRTFSADEHGNDVSLRGIVEEARLNYRIGLSMSPGTDGRYPPRK